jgi:hypothetical protein
MPIRITPPIKTNLHRILLAAVLSVVPLMGAPKSNPVRQAGLVPGAEGSNSAGKSARAEAVPGEFLVRFKPSAEAQARSAPFNALRRSGSTSVASLRGLESRFRLKEMKEAQEDPYEAVTRKLRSLSAPSTSWSPGPKADRLRKRLENLQASARIGKRGRIYKLAFDPKAGSDESMLAELKKNPDIESVQPNHLYYTDATIPNDPYLSMQNSVNTVHATSAWDVTTGSDNVVVAVIDVGVDWKHHDLTDNIWSNVDEIAGDGIDNDGNGYIDDVRGWDFVEAAQSDVAPGEDFGPQDNDPMDFLGHGSHVSGIIAARGNNLIGIAGMNWRAKIMALRAGYAVPGGNGTLTDEAIAGALHYAALNGADVVNMSFGSPYFSPFDYEAIQFAQAAGCLLIGAAGNSASPLKFYPADLNEVVSVAATFTDHTTFFSNWGANVDISAPGYDIMSSTPGGGYGNKSGTSMASPLVAGVAALTMAAHPDWTREQVVHQMLSTTGDIDAVNIGTGGKLGSGLVDAARCVGPYYTGHKVNLSNVLAMDLQGDKDGQLEAGETVDLVLSLRNYSLTKAYNAVIATNDPFIQIVKSGADFGSIGEGLSKSNSASAFTFKIAANVPVDHQATFTVDIFSAGVKVKTAPFEIHGLASKWSRNHLVGPALQNYGQTLHLQDGRLLILSELSAPPANGILASFRSADGTFDEPFRINPESQSSYAYASSMDENGNLYVAYVGIATVWPDLEIYIRKYDIASRTWGPITQVTTDEVPSPFELALSARPGGMLNVIWIGFGTGAEYTPYSKSFDGTSWGPTTSLHATTTSARSLSVLAPGNSSPVLLYASADIQYLREAVNGSWGPEITLGVDDQTHGIPFVQGSGIYRLGRNSTAQPWRIETLENRVWNPYLELFADNYLGDEGNGPYYAGVSIFDANNMDFVSLLGGPYDPAVGAITEMMNLHGRNMVDGVWSGYRTYDDYSRNYQDYPQASLSNDGVKFSYMTLNKRIFNDRNITAVYRTTEPIASSHIPTQPTLVINSNQADPAGATLAFTISSNHPQGIGTYEYALGTLPGENDLQDWTFSESPDQTTFINRADLAPDQEYFVSFRAHSRGIYSSALSISSPLKMAKVVPVISANVSMLGFSGIPVGYVGFANLQLSNTGSADLVVGQLEFSDARFEADAFSAPLTIAPGGTQTLRICYHPSATATLSGSLKVHSNDPLKPVLTVSLSGTATSSTWTRVINSDADSYNQGGTFANTNYGLLTELVVNNASVASETRRSVVRFDLASVKGRVLSAAARLRNFQDGGTMNVDLLTSSNWTETGVTWNNRPALGPRQSVVSLGYGWNGEMPLPGLMTAAVIAEKKVTLALSGGTTTLVDFHFASRQSTNTLFQPLLMVKSEPFYAQDFEVSESYSNLSRIAKPSTPSGLAGSWVGTLAVPATTTAAKSISALQTGLTGTVYAGRSMTLISKVGLKSAESGDIQFRIEVTFNNGTVVKGAWLAMSSANTTAMTYSKAITVPTGAASLSKIALVFIQNSTSKAAQTGYVDGVSFE